MKTPNLSAFALTLREYFHTYDPAKFALIYTAKSVLALLCVFIAAFALLPPASVIFAIFTSVFVFYMHAFCAQGAAKIAYLLAFSCVSALIALAVPFLAASPLALIAIGFVWIFAAAICAGINDDMHKIAIYCTLLAMAMLINATLRPFDAEQAALSVLLGGGISIAFRCFSFYSYGSFTRKNFHIILQDLKLLARELNTADYEHWQNVLQGRLDAFKRAISSQSANIKDPSLIRNQEMVSFYFIKCQEIAQILSSLRVFFRRNAHNAHIAALQAEICANLAELERIFKDERAELQSATLERLERLGSLPILCENLRVLYYKMQLFASGGSEKLRLKKPSFALKFCPRELFSYHNKYFRYALKTALASSLALALASFLQLDHGVWIAMGTFTLFKEKINATKINNKDTLIGSLAGFAIGLGLIFCLSSSALLYAILAATYALAIYFRHFPQRLAMVFIMMNLAVFFCAAGLDYERLIFYRLADFVAAYAIVLCFSALWPATSEGEIKPEICSFCEQLGEFLAQISSKKSPSEEKVNAEILLAHLNSINKLFTEAAGKNSALEFAKITAALADASELCLSLGNFCAQKNLGAYAASDIGIIAQRFFMLQTSQKNLPAYVYENLGDKLLSSDKTLRFYCLEIFEKQSIIYEFLGK